MVFGSVAFGFARSVWSWSECDNDMKKRGVYLRFLYSLSPSCSVTYSNPFSMSCFDCSTVWAVLHMQLSSCSSVSSWVYIRVWFMLLCPSCCLTNNMSLVCRYSIVAK